MSGFVCVLNFFILFLGLLFSVVFVVGHVLFSQPSAVLVKRFSATTIMETNHSLNTFAVSLDIGLHLDTSGIEV